MPTGRPGHPPTPSAATALAQAWPAMRLLALALHLPRKDQPALQPVKAVAGSEADTVGERAQFSCCSATRRRYTSAYAASPLAVASRARASCDSSSSKVLCALHLLDFASEKQPHLFRVHVLCRCALRRGTADLQAPSIQLPADRAFRVASRCRCFPLPCLPRAYPINSAISF